MMMKQIKRLILLGAVCGIVYSLLAYHLVFSADMSNRFEK